MPHRCVLQGMRKSIEYTPCQGCLAEHTHRNFVESLEYVSPVRRGKPALFSLLKGTNHGKCSFAM